MTASTPKLTVERVVSLVCYERFGFATFDNKIDDVPLDGKYIPTDGDPFLDPSLYRMIVGSLIYLKKSKKQDVLSRSSTEAEYRDMAMTTTHEIWIAIERLQQVESLNKQDVKTSLFWEFGKFTSRDGKSIESYYSIFCRMMNEILFWIYPIQLSFNKPSKIYLEGIHKMLLCKQAEKGVPLQAEQANWQDDTDEEVDEQELEAHHIQHSEQPVSINNTCLVEKVDSNVILDSLDMCDNENQTDQNAEECDDERVMLAKLIANLKLDTDENKKIQKQLKKANTSLAHELQECKSALEKYKSSLEEPNRT
nr:hypothetical protein [Tanacetum cinerariifolium]